MAPCSVGAPCAFTGAVPKITAMTPSVKAIPAEPVSSSGLRPIRSMSKIATTVVTEAAIAVAGWCFVGRRHRLPWVRLSWRVVLAGLVMGLVIFPLAGRSIAADEVHFIAEAAVVEVGARVLAVLHFDLQRHHRAERAAPGERR